MQAKPMQNAGKSTAAAADTASKKRPAEAAAGAAAAKRTRPEPAARVTGGGLNWDNSETVNAATKLTPTIRSLINGNSSDVQVDAFNLATLSMGDLGAYKGQLMMFKKTHSLCEKDVKKAKKEAIAHCMTYAKECNCPAEILTMIENMLNATKDASMEALQSFFKMKNLDITLYHVEEPWLLNDVLKNIALLCKFMTDEHKSINVIEAKSEEVKTMRIKLEALRADDERLKAEVAQKRKELEESENRSRQMSSKVAQASKDIDTIKETIEQNSMQTMQNDLSSMKAEAEKVGEELAVKLRDEYLTNEIVRRGVNAEAMYHYRKALIEEVQKEAGVPPPPVPS